MENVGEKFKEARESMEISIEEASEDLKVEPSDIENIENGNIKAFDNVVNLKYLLKDYSKYLGLDTDEILDEYNEYLFDCTSKISLEDIKEARRRIAQSEKKENKIKSPYTNFKNRTNVKKILLVLLIIFIILLIVLGTIKIIDEIKSNTDKNISNVIR